MLARKCCRMLEKFRQAKQAEIRRLLESDLAPVQRSRPDFRGAISGRDRIAVIAEYKRASPSKGRIRFDLDAATVARQYWRAGAAAISILTEETFFDGRLGYLEEAEAATGGEIPLLRKDFIFHPAQIAATAQTPAAAILLIARMYAGAQELRSLREYAEKLGLAAVVEIFDESDLGMARDAGAEIIQANSRNLATLQVDRTACLRLVAKARPEEVWIAASGISRPEHVAEAARAGYQAILVGGALMEKGQPGENLARLLGGGGEA